MGDRTQRVTGKTEEVKGRAKRKTGVATGRPGTEARGAGGPSRAMKIIEPRRFGAGRERTATPQTRCTGHLLRG
jgi:hypothetical protein